MPASRLLRDPCEDFTLSRRLRCRPRPPAPTAQKAKAIANLKHWEGKPLGHIDLATLNRGVLVTFALHDLLPAAQALHLHTSSNRDAKSAFADAAPS